MALLEHKNAVIYGAGGQIASAVSRTFAREGATVFLTGRGRESLERLAEEIVSAGGSAFFDVLDALDEAAVDEHVRSVAARAGSLDISFNLISRGDVQGTPLVDMTVADFMQAVTVGLRSNFITARAAARQMIEQQAGAILTLTGPSAAASSPLRASSAGFQMGGSGPADAATETFVRYLASELGQHGVRVVSIRTAGVLETISATFANRMAELSTLGRLPTLAQVAATAAFLASDQAGAITGTTTDATSGFTLE